MDTGTEPFDDHSHHANKWAGLAWVGGIAVIVVLVVVGLPALGKRVPWRWEKNLSHVLGAMPADVCARQDNDAWRAFDKLTKRIFPVLPGDDKIPITYHVVRKDEVNAFASLGADVYIYSKLLDVTETPEELAGVLAHEMGHLSERHLMQSLLGRNLPFLLLRIFGMGSSGDVLLSLAGLHFSRGQEAEADDLAIARLTSVKVNVKGFLDFFERISKDDHSLALLSDHPAPRDRAASIKPFLSKPSTPILSAAEWKALKGICQK